MKTRGSSSLSRSLYTLVNKFGEIVAPDNKSIVGRRPINLAGVFGTSAEFSRKYTRCQKGIEGTMAPGLMKYYLSRPKEELLKHGYGINIFMLCPGIGPSVSLVHQKKYQEWHPDPMSTAQSTLLATLISGLYTLRNLNNDLDEMLLLGLAPAAELNMISLGKMNESQNQLEFSAEDLLKAYESTLKLVCRYTTPTIILSPFAIPNTIHYQPILPVLDELSKLDHIIHVAASGTSSDKHAEAPLFFPALSKNTVIACSADYNGGVFSLERSLDPRACMNYGENRLYIGAPSRAHCISPKGDEIWSITGSCCASANVAAIIAAIWSRNLHLNNHNLLEAIRKNSRKIINVSVPNLLNHMNYDNDKGSVFDISHGELFF